MQVNGGIFCKKFNKYPVKRHIGQKYCKNRHTTNAKFYAKRCGTINTWLILKSKDFVLKCLHKKGGKDMEPAKIGDVKIFQSPTGKHLQHLQITHRRKTLKFWKKCWQSGVIACQFFCDSL